MSNKITIDLFRSGIMRIVVSFFFSFLYATGFAQNNSCKPNVPVAVIIESVFYDGKNKVPKECTPCYVFKATDDRFKVTGLIISIDYCNPFSFLKDIDQIIVKGDMMTPKDSYELKRALLKNSIWFECVIASFGNGYKYVLQPLFHSKDGFKRLQ